MATGHGAGEARLSAEKSVSRRGGVVLRPSGPWTAGVPALLRHLERVGFTGAPRVVEPGQDADGREMVTFVEGEFVHPGPWSDAVGVGAQRGATRARGWRPHGAGASRSPGREALSSAGRGQTRAGEPNPQ